MKIEDTLGSLQGLQKVLWKIERGRMESVKKSWKENKRRKNKDTPFRKKEENKKNMKEKMKSEKRKNKEKIGLTEGFWII